MIINQIKNAFSDVFEELLGEFNVNKVSLRVEENALPIFCKARPLPLAWKSKVETKLKDLIKSGVLERAVIPTGELL